MIRNKVKSIAAFAIAAMMAASITPAMAAPSFAAEENTEATTMEAEELFEETDEVITEDDQAAGATVEESEEETAEEPQQEEVTGEKTESKGVLRTMAATSQSGAQTISIGQRVTGSFAKDQSSMTHYYKFRTNSTSGVSYTLKAEFLSYIPDAKNDGLDFGLKDRNGNYVFNSNREHYMFLSNMASTVDSITYDNLTPNTDYYIWVENPWIGMNAKKYAVSITSSGNSGTTTPSVVTPVLTVDKTSITSKDKSNVYVTGTVSKSVGQFLGVYDSNTELLYNYVQLSNTNGKVSFRIQVPSTYLKDGTQSFTVKSLPQRNIINGSNIVRINVTIGDVSSNTNNQNHATVYPVHKVTVGGSVYEVLQHKQIGGPAARLVKAKNAKNVTIPSTIKFKGVHYSVTGIQPNAFKNSKAKKVTIKTIKLTKSSVKSSLAKSKVKTIKVKAGNKKLNKNMVKKYKKYFAKGNSGKKVNVK